MYLISTIALRLNLVQVAVSMQQDDYDILDFGNVLDFD